MSFSIAVQTAIYQKLNTDLTVPVYDDVPELASNWKTAYVTIGEDVFTYADTDTENMQRCSITIHVWSRYSGRKECKDIQGEIYNSLHRANLSHPGYKFITITEDSATSVLDPDGLTRHGVQTFNLLIEEI